MGFDEVVKAAYLYIVLTKIWFQFSVRLDD